MQSTIGRKTNQNNPKLASLCILLTGTDKVVKHCSCTVAESTLCKIICNCIIFRHLDIWVEWGLRIICSKELIYQNIYVQVLIVSCIPVWATQLHVYSVSSVLVIFAYTDERSIDVEGGWSWCWAEGMDLVPIVGRGFPCACLPTPPHLHLPCGTALLGGEGTEHCAIEGINWWHLFGAHGQSN